MNSFYIGDKIRTLYPDYFNIKYICISTTKFYYIYNTQLKMTGFNNIKDFKTYYKLYEN
jgi:hypothetical protein